jgi:putative ABC transport system ATP-binding protein
MRLSVQGLSRTFQSGDESRRALHDVSLTIEPGEFVAIMGRSGSGKTTLLNSLGALDTRFDGEILLGETSLRDLSEKDLAALRHRHLGFVFQSYNLLHHLTVLENVLLPSFFGPLREERTPRQIAEDLLRKVDLGDRLHARPSELSGGQRQRVAIARALLCRPSVLLCDEPTGSLDRATGLSILRLFQELNSQGITVILVTHEPHVADVAHRRVQLEDGRIIADQEQTPRWPEPAPPGDEPPGEGSL